jgi:hypothetical protein
MVQCTWDRTDVLAADRSPISGPRNRPATELRTLCSNRRRARKTHRSRPPLHRHAHLACLTDQAIGMLCDHSQSRIDTQVFNLSRSMKGCVRKSTNNSCTRFTALPTPYSTWGVLERDDEVRSVEARAHVFDPSPECRQSDPADAYSIISCVTPGPSVPDVAATSPVTRIKASAAAHIPPSVRPPYAGTPAVAMAPMIG